MENNPSFVSIDEVRVGPRQRSDLGDIDSLARSIQAVGLLHPIVINEESLLIAGVRRLEAFRRLGETHIPANIVSYLAETLDLLLAERDENVCRKEFRPTEAAAMAQRLREIEAPKAKERQRQSKGRGKKKTSAKLAEPIGETRAAVAAGVGLGHTTLAKIEAIVEAAAEEPELFGDLPAKMDATGKVDTAYRELKKRKVVHSIQAEAAPLPEGPFRVIVIDPPWRYDSRAADGTHRGALPYPDMSVEEICALPVADHAGPDCILWLWTTNAFLRSAFQCLDAWGFQEKTVLTWVKDRMGVGDWLRGKTEHCILAVRGKPAVTLTNQTTALVAPMREHSRKPDEFYALVEALCPGSKLEMFARQQREGWISWGAERGSFDAQG